MPPTTEKVRVQFDFTSDALAELDDLKSKLKAQTRAEVIRHALRVFRWLIQTIREGGRILVERSDGQVQSVVFPFVGEERSQTEASRPLKVAQAAEASRSLKVSR